MFAMMRFVIPLSVLLMLLLVQGCGDRSPSAVPAAPEEEAPVSPAPITVKVDPVQMLSRSEQAFQAARAAVEPDPLPAAAAEQEAAAGVAADDAPSRPRAQVSKILYRYVQPERMMTYSNLLEEVASVDEEAPQRDQEAPPPELDLVALSYITKRDMLSVNYEGIRQQMLRAAPAAEVYDGVGFIEDPGALVVEADDKMIDQMVTTSRDPESVQRAMYYVREAEDAFERKSLAEAFDWYARALRLFPDTTYVNRQLGRISLMQGRYVLAIGYLTAALDADESAAETLNDLGIAYLYSGDYERALKVFDAAIKTDDTMSEPVYNGSLALRMLGRLGEAKDRINAFLVYSPREARAYRELGMLNLVASNRVEAMTMFESAINNEPEWDLPYFDAARMMAEEGRYEDALAMLDRALEVADPLAVLRVYKSDGFTEVRLIPESRGFESRLIKAARAWLRSKGSSAGSAARPS